MTQQHYSNVEFTYRDIVIENTQPHQKDVGLSVLFSCLSKPGLETCAEKRSKRPLYVISIIVSYCRKSAIPTQTIFDNF